MGRAELIEHRRLTKEVSTYFDTPDGALSIETESKAACEAACPCEADDPELPIDATGADAFRAIVTGCLGHLLANVAATRSDLDCGVEGVHQMRVAIRRTRAALVVFRPLLEPQAAKGFEAELRRIGRVLGEARDWDVFCTEILPGTLSDAATAGWRDLLATSAAERRTAARQRVLEELDTPGLTALVLGLAAWAEELRSDAGVPGGAPLARRFAKQAPALLDRLADQVDRRGRHIARRSGPELHALRKSLKKLRYSIDFVGDVVPGKHRKAYGKHLRALQKNLGDINDGATALQLAESLTAGPRVDLAPAIAMLAQRLAPAQEKAYHQLRKAWRAFRSEERWWD